MKVSIGLAAIIMVLNTIPAGAEAVQSSPQTLQQTRTTVGNRAGNQYAHFLRQGEVGYGTRLMKLPDNYPLPVPPGATQDLSQSVVSDRGNNGFYLRMHAPHTRSELIDWYLAQLKSSGWQVDQPLPSDQGMAITANRPNGSGAVLIFYNAPKGGTDIITNGTL